ncbi:MAG: tetratricopeptide repeat protein [Chloroflexia bacterium]
MGEVEELYWNGLAALQAGNRRLARAFFQRVVILEPRHEEAWLRLSEVLDDPEDVAYCLKAVLTLHPDHPQARVTLDVLEEQQKGRPQPARPPADSPLAEVRRMDLLARLSEMSAGAASGTGGKRLFQEMFPLAVVLRVTGFALSVLLVLFLAVYLAVQPVNDLPPTETPVPTLDRALLDEQKRGVVRAYFGRLDALLGPLRLAHDLYRSRSNLRVSLPEQMEHVRVLRGQVAEALEGLKQLPCPPDFPALAEAQQEYIQGLALEQEGLNHLLRYYETLQADFSRRAADKFQEAGEHLGQAREIWKAYRTWVGLPEPTPLPTPTPLITPTYGPTPTSTPTLPPFPTRTPTPFPTNPIG